MTHMALIDGHFADEERREIEDVIDEFSQYKTKLKETMDFVVSNGNKDNYIFNLLNQVRDMLSAEALFNLMAKSAVVLLADGKIEKEEETLMKEYLVACGIPKDFYSPPLDKLKKVH